MILKECFDCTDDEMVENLMFDIRYQIALHKTSFKEQPFSDKTLSRFRKRCYEYETMTGVDLIHECVKNLSGAIAKIMDITGKYRRMDSIMVEANIKKLSRLELIYKCLSNYAQYIHKTDSTALPSDLLHYTEPDDFNKIFYHQRSSNADECAAQLLFDADKLLDLSKKSNTISKDYAMLTRCLSEQTIYKNGKRRLRTKDDGPVPSDSLQNPSDPDATFRTKMGKAHRGYVDYSP